jgi:acyl carrier protein
LFGAGVRLESLTYEDQTEAHRRRLQTKWPRSHFTSRQKMSYGFNDRCAGRYLAQRTVEAAKGPLRTTSRGMQTVVSDLAAIRDILAQHGRLSVHVKQLKDDSDLYYAGLTSLATVNVMLALEDRFGVEFPDALLSRKTFTSLESIAEAVAELVR